MRRPLHWNYRPRESVAQQMWTLPLVKEVVLRSGEVFASEVFLVPRCGPNRFFFSVPCFVSEAVIWPYMVMFIVDV